MSVDPSGTDPDAQARRKKPSGLAWDCLLISIVWFAGLMIVNPFGDFPLNDDWSYGLTVKTLVESGEFRPTGWTLMPLLTNALWGSLFCLPFGFSFSALRLSTLVLSLLGTLGTYILIRDARHARSMALLGALTVGLNPIYFALSYTFMTDVPYTALTVSAAVLFARVLKNDSDLELLAATAITVAAALSRQLAVVIPVAFSVALLMKRGVNRSTAARAATSVIPPLACYVLFRRWLDSSGRIPALNQVKSEKLLDTLTDPNSLIPYLVDNSYVSLVYLGWFLLPVLVVVIMKTWRRFGLKSLALFVATLGGLLMFYGRIVAVPGRNDTMPLSVNILAKSGIGPLTLRDTYLLRLDHVQELPGFFWLAVTGASLAGAACLVTLLATGIIRVVIRLWTGKTRHSDVLGTFLVLAGMLSLAPFLVGDFLDRYVLPTVPLFVAGLLSLHGEQARPTKRRASAAWLLAAALLAPTAVYGIAGTRDYLEWNRVRWRALGHLMQNESVSARQIDGGFEFNGWLLFDPEYRRRGRKSWWWVERDEYQVGFGEVRGYRVVDEYRYRRWAPPGDGRIVVLRRVSRELREPGSRPTDAPESDDGH